MSELLQQLIDTSAIHRPRRTPRHDNGAASPLQLEPAFISEHSIRQRHGIEVDPEVEGQLTDWWQQIARPEPLFHQMATQIAGNLPVRRSGGAEIDRDAGCSSHCLMSMYNRH